MSDTLNPYKNRLIDSNLNLKVDYQKKKKLEKVRKLSIYDN